MSDADAGRAGATSDAAAAASAREPESPRAAAAPTTRDLQVAEESKPQQQQARAADAARREAGSQVFGGGDDARAVFAEHEARRAVPETGETASPYAQTPATQAQAASPLPVQAEEAAASGVPEDRRGRVARVREGTRARVENTRARVERVKGDALVALEETPDDSGLRFVAVAAVLFVLFIAFLFLSVTVLR